MTQAMKDQARRLAAYLNRVHGIQLQHGHALEAVAAAHGFESWNAACAGATDIPLGTRTREPFTAIEDQGPSPDVHAAAVAMRTATPGEMATVSRFAGSVLRSLQARGYSFAEILPEHRAVDPAFQIGAAVYSGDRLEGLLGFTVRGVIHMPHDGESSAAFEHDLGQVLRAAGQ